MKSDLTIHPVQGKIINALRFRKEARFSELNVEKLSNDHFTFHINRLISQALIRKTSTNKYELTNHGKAFANRLDEDTMSVIKQGKVAVLIVCENKTANVKKYLVQQRLKHPYYNYYGFIGGLVKWGEETFQAAKRILLKETGFIAYLTLIGVNHKIDTSKFHDVLEDKYYFVFSAENLNGGFIAEPKGGENAWMSIKEIEALHNQLSGIKIAMRFLSNKSLQFVEKVPKNINNKEIV